MSIRFGKPRFTRTGTPRTCRAASASCLRSSSVPRGVGSLQVETEAGSARIRPQAAAHWIERSVEQQVFDPRMIVGHPEMPVMDLKPTEIDDLIAYLRSLQRTGRPAQSRSRDS